MHIFETKKEGESLGKRFRVKEDDGFGRIRPM